MVKCNVIIEFVDEDVLYKVVVVEGVKGYYSKEVDKENQEGFFFIYKLLVVKIVFFILEINLGFIYLCVLVSIFLEMVKDQVYFVEYLFCLMDVEIKNGNLSEVE